MTLSPSASIVLIGKNDNYHEDYIHRTSACLSYNLNSIHTSGLTQRIHILFIDWGSTVPLSEAIAIPEELKSVVSYIHLSPTTLKDAGLPTILEPAAAANVGLLQSASDYVFWAASDLLAAPHDFANFHFGLTMHFNENSEKAQVITCDRAFLPASYFKNPRSPRDLDYFLSRSYFPHGPVSSVGGNAALIGGLRQTLLDCNGLNMLTKGWGGNDIDLFLRLTRDMPALNISRTHGAYFFKYPYAREGDRQARTARQSFSLGGADFQRLSTLLSAPCPDLDEIKKISNITQTPPSNFRAFATFPTTQSNKADASPLSVISRVAPFKAKYSEWIRTHSSLRAAAKLCPDVLLLVGPAPWWGARALTQMCNTSTLIWQFPPDGGVQVLDFMSLLRKPMAGRPDLLFFGQAQVTPSDLPIQLSPKTRDYLTGKTVLRIKWSRNGVLFGKCHTLPPLVECESSTDLNLVFDEFSVPTSVFSCIYIALISTATRVRLLVNKALHKFVPSVVRNAI